MYTTRYSWRDWLTAAALSIVMLLVTLANMTTGVPDWGDDHSAYISEAISIVDGTFDAQNQLNPYLHPSVLPEEAKGEKLVYVWGYPLMLTPIYRAVGFDRENFDDIWYYKIPSALCFSLLAGVMFLFFRRRFERLPSAGMALLFYARMDMIHGVNNLYADVAFLFFSMLLLLMMEVFVTHVSERGWGLFTALFYGVTLWFTREVRLNGTTVCAVCLIGHAIAVITRQAPLNRRNAWRHALPYLVMLALTLVSERLWLSPATSNLSDLGRVSLRNTLSNGYHLVGSIYMFFDCMTGLRTYIFGLAALAVMAIGVLSDGFRRNLHLTLMLGGSILVVAMLPYFQGSRYIYNLMPLALMYAAYGARFIREWAKKRWPERRDAIRRAACALAAVLVCLSFVRVTVFSAHAFAERDKRDDKDMYSAPAVDIYHYIQKNVPENAIIAFWKPRALYLNTQRKCFRGDTNHHSIEEPDFYLHIKTVEKSVEITEKIRPALKLLYENEYFQFFKVDLTGLEIPPAKDT